MVAVFASADGRPAALLDGTAITAIHTAAGSALAMRLLARENAATIAILGTGVQAASHARVVTRVRPFRELRVAGRTRAKAEALAAELDSDLDLPVRATASFAKACDGADVICAVTHVDEPVVRRESIQPGAHVTSVGYNPGCREVDDRTVVDALVVVESRAAALAPFPAGSTDLLQPLERGLIGADHVHAEVGELVAGEQWAVPRRMRSLSTSRSARRSRTAPRQRSRCAPPARAAPGARLSSSRGPGSGWIRSAFSPVRAPAG